MAVLAAAIAVALCTKVAFEKAIKAFCFTSLI